MELPAVWPWVRGFPCFIPLPSFPIQISEIKDNNACPANATVGVPLTGWRCPRQVLWPWVRGEGPKASGHAGSCIALSQDRHYTLLGIAHYKALNIIRHCTLLGIAHHQAMLGHALHTARIGNPHY